MQTKIRKSLFLNFTTAKDTRYSSVFLHFSYKLFSAIISAAGAALSCYHFPDTAPNFSQGRAER